MKLAEGWFFRPLDEFVDHECYTDQMVARAYVWDVIERGGTVLQMSLCDARVRSVHPEVRNAVAFLTTP